MRAESSAARDMAGGEAALARELADFLVEFSIVLHKRSMYPAGHPYLQSSADRFIRRLESLLELRSSVTLGVARDRLVIETVTTDPSNALLRELANRLHRHQIASISFAQGADEEEIEGLLNALSADPQRGEVPFGRRLDTAEAWGHIRLRAAGYASLTLQDEAAASESEAAGSRDFWVELAQAALSGREDADVPADADPLVVARAIDRNSGETAYDSVVLGYLSQIAEESSGRVGAGEERLRRRVSHLLTALDPETLRRLLETGADQSQRSQLLLGASQTLAVDAVVAVLEAAAETSHHTISSNLLRLLHKFALQAQTGSSSARSDADGALRRNVARLIADWQLADPNPGAYSAILEGMVRQAPAPRAREAETSCDPEVILRMAVELGCAGPTVCTAADVLCERGQITRASAILDSYPASDATKALWLHVATPARLASELESSPLDHAAVAMLAARLGAAAADPLLDALERAPDRSSRAAILRQLRALGTAAGAAAAARLPESPWFLQRNILLLIGQSGAWPEGFSPAAYAAHPDIRVRREAIKLLLESSPHHADAVLTGLRDPDDGIVALTLGAAVESCPPDAWPLIHQIAAEPRRDSAVRVLAVRALARSRMPEALGVLVALALGRRRWFGNPLAPKSPELLAIVSALARHWREEPQAAAVLMHALRHQDAEIRNAARGAGA